MREVPYQAILAIEPSLIPVSDGSWLAIAGEAAPTRAGAFGATQGEARLHVRSGIASSGPTTFGAEHDQAQA